MSDELFDRLVKSFIAANGRGPNLLETIMMHEAVASTRLDHDRKGGTYTARPSQVRRRENDDNAQD